MKRNKIQNKGSMNFNPKKNLFSKKSNILVMTKQRKEKKGNYEIHKFKDEKGKKKKRKGTRKQHNL